MKFGNYRISPFLLLLFALMAAQSIRRYSSFSEWLLMTAVTLPGILIGLSFHEFAHAEVADLCGDPTAKNLGRVTINPIAHIDPVGFLCLLFLGFGWGIAVPYNPNNLRNRRRGELAISLAGVAMNFIIAIISGAVYVAMFKAGHWPSLGNGMGGVMAYVVFYIMEINLVLMVFNLLPIPPLDGFGVLDALLNFDGQSRAVEFLRRNGFLVLMLLIIFDVVDMVLSPAVSALMGLIINIFA